MNHLNQDGLAEAVSGFIDVKVVGFHRPIVFISEVREQLPVSVLANPSGKALVLLVSLSGAS